MSRTRLVILILSLTGLLLSCKKEEGPTEPSSPDQPVPDPIASFTISGDTVTPATIRFQNTSQNADSFRWDFGDSTISTLTSPTKTYSVRGLYTVSLTARNSASNRSASDTKQITITPGRVFLTALLIREIPYSNATGLPWDIGSSPDLYPTFIDKTNTIVTFRDQYYSDLPPGFGYKAWPLTPAYEITDWQKIYFVECWDRDLIDDDYIGATSGFSIESVIYHEGYPTHVSLQNPTGSIKADAHFTWE